MFTDEMKLWVAVPVLNEEKLVEGLLLRLHELSINGEEFDVVFCDNGSTDDTIKIIERFLLKYEPTWHLIHEPVKGTGAAADTAIRFAIENGATHVARTDGDCLPDLNWLIKIEDLFTSTDVEMIAGAILARLDDTNISKQKAKFFDFLVPFAALFGKLRPLNRQPGMHGTYVMTAGCNMAISAELYEKCGGFPRTKIEEVHEDRVLINRVRMLTPNFGYYPKVKVNVSARRITEWGVVNTLRWYANHSYCPPHVDIR